jgi:hypothetical protein
MQSQAILVFLSSKLSQLQCSSNFNDFKGFLENWKSLNYENVADASIIEHADWESYFTSVCYYGLYVNEICNLIHFKQNEKLLGDAIQDEMKDFLEEQSWDLGSLVIPVLMVEAKNAKTIEVLSSLVLETMCNCTSPKEILLWSLQVVSALTWFMLNHDLEEEMVTRTLNLFLVYSRLWLDGNFI